MAQTTGQISFKDAKIELSTNGSAWTNVSGESNTITIDGGDTNIESFHTWDSQYPLLGVGGDEVIDIKIKVVYLESASSAQDILAAAKAAQTPVYVRYSPKGGNTGDKQYTSTAGYVRNNPYPSGEAGKGDVVAMEYTIAVPQIVPSTVA